MLKYKQKSMSKMQRQQSVFIYKSVFVSNFGFWL